MDDYPFDEFWSIYPRKVARAYAERCWTKLSPAYRQLALGAISAHVEHWKARKLDWDKLPHCSTWLNQQRWNDELPKINGQRTGPLPTEVSAAQPPETSGPSPVPALQTKEGIRRGIAACKAVLSQHREPGEDREEDAFR